MRPFGNRNRLGFTHRWCALLALVIATTLGGCATFFQSTSDERSLAIFYASLFNQRTGKATSGVQWGGDWLFRRERLLLVDKFLRDRKPDVLVMQEVMSRDGSFSESDLNIVGTQSLSGYKWDELEVNDYPDTGETEFHAVGSGLPVRPVRIPPTIQRYWSLGKGLGHVTLFILELDQRQIPVFNVEAHPGTAADHDLVFASLTKIIRDAVLRDHYCPKRIIIAGRMPASYTSQALANFYDALQIKDVSAGFCELASDCYTASPINEIYMKTSNGQVPSQMDRILVHRSAFVQSAATVLNVPEDDDSFVSTYGMSKVWPTERFGWYSNVRLQRCDADEYWDESMLKNAQDGSSQ